MNRMVVIRPEEYAHRCSQNCRHLSPEYLESGQNRLLASESLRRAQLGNLRSGYKARREARIFL